MPKRSTVLKELLRQRHWQTYATFCRQYDDAAQTIDAMLVGHWPSRGQFARWLSGDIKGLPHSDHCRVLEAMFDGLSVQELFSVADRSRQPVPTVAPLSPITPADALALPIPAARRAPEHPAADSLAGGGYTPVGHLPGSPSRPLGGHIPGVHLPVGDTLGGHPRDSRFSGNSPRSSQLSGSRPPGSQAPGSRPPDDRLPADTSAADQLPGDQLPESSAPGYVRPEELAITAEESARFVRGTSGGVDHDVLDQLGADVRQLATEYLARPPLLLFRPLSRLRAEVFEMLDRRQRPGLLPPLYAVAGRLCALLAHASADLGHSYAAETHTRTAWLCADLADDDSLRAYVRWVQSNVAYWDGDYHRAAQIAYSGQRYATKGSNLLRLASQEARAWAACGETAEVERALALAERTRERPVVDDQAGVFRFDPGKAAYYASEIRLALGGAANARLAVQDANESLELFALTPQPQRSPEFVAAARLDLANAHLALSDLDTAAGQLRLVLRLPVECRTEPIVGRVAATDVTLRSPRFTHSALALELRDEIALFRAYPARRDLSEALD